MLTIDSLSRKQFFRKLPRTKDYINSIDTQKFSVFDFKLHQIMGDNSLPNVWPIWTGTTLSRAMVAKKNENRVTDGDLTNGDGIWHYLRENGWVTMLGQEFCDIYFADGLGKRPKVDHLLNQFWCAAEKLSGFDDLGTFQRCIGNENSHYYLVDYVDQFLRGYKGLNKFAFVQTLAGHERTGTVMATLD
jgi:hypothetical protein